MHRVSRFQLTDRLIRSSFLQASSRETRRFSYFDRIGQILMDIREWEGVLAINLKGKPRILRNGSAEVWNAKKQANLRISSRINPMVFVEKISKNNQVKQSLWVGCFPENRTINRVAKTMFTLHIEPDEFQRGDWGDGKHAHMYRERKISGQDEKTSHKRHWSSSKHVC